MKNLFRILCVAACLLATALQAQTNAAQHLQEQGITRQQADEILKELRAIRQLLEKGARPPAAAQAQAAGTVSVQIEDGQWLGSRNAPLTIVEYTDYQCPFCRSFYISTFPEIRKKYIDTGLLRFITRDLPLDFHPDAMRAAEAARCAADQGKFWEMRDLMTADPRKLSEQDLIGYAQKLALGMPDFKACLTNGKYRDSIRHDMSEAAALHIDGTPSFVIGRSTPDGVEGEIVVGAQPFAAFDAKLRQLRPANK
jgi:protein-disulfide isomerase